MPVEVVKETVAIDREIHQDHHQVRIQPVEDHVREAERHEAKVLPVQHRETHHGKEAEIKRRLEEEARIPSIRPSIHNSSASD